MSVVMLTLDVQLIRRRKSEIRITQSYPYSAACIAGDNTGIRRKRSSRSMTDVTIRLKIFRIFQVNDRHDLMLRDR